MSLFLFFVALLASAVGSVVGAGGGVIIKPVLDLLGVLPVSTVSFCSGCTVLGMSVFSLIHNRKDGIRLHLKTSTLLAVGAVCGGLVGKALFEAARAGGSERMLGGLQAVFLTLITFGVLLYVCFKSRLPSRQVTSPIAVLVIGMALGVISSFLGIGGGTSNVAVLFYFFSMNAKEAAKNSLYIIIFSQLSSIGSALVTGSVPAFSWPHLLFMVAGGIAGAAIGSAVSKRINNSGVESILKVLLILITAVDLYNAVKYLLF